MSLKRILYAYAACVFATMALYSCSQQSPTDSLNYEALFQTSPDEFLNIEIQNSDSCMNYLTKNLFVIDGMSNRKGIKMFFSDFHELTEIDLITQKKINYSWLLSDNIIENGGSQFRDIIVYVDENGPPESRYEKIKGEIRKGRRGETIGLSSTGSLIRKSRDEYYLPFVNSPFTFTSNSDLPLSEPCPCTFSLDSSSEIIMHSGDDDLYVTINGILEHLKFVREHDKASIYENESYWVYLERKLNVSENVENLHELGDDGLHPSVYECTGTFVIINQDKFSKANGKQFFSGISGFCKC